MSFVQFHLVNLVIFSFVEIDVLVIMGDNSLDKKMIEAYSTLAVFEYFSANFRLVELQKTSSVEVGEIMLLSNQIRSDYILCLIKSISFILLMFFMCSSNVQGFGIVHVRSELTKLLDSMRPDWIVINSSEI